MDSPEFPATGRSHGANGGMPKRKHSTMDSSPGSIGDHDDDRDDGSPETKGRRLPGVKRACNECRQQKVGC
jgi:hypothetical protein